MRLLCASAGEKTQADQIGSVSTLLMDAVEGSSAHATGTLEP